MKKRKKKHAASVADLDPPSWVQIMNNLHEKIGDVAKMYVANKAPEPIPFRADPPPYSFHICGNCLRPLFDNGSYQRVRWITIGDGSSAGLCVGCQKLPVTLEDLKPCSINPKLKRIRIEVEDSDGTIRADEWSTEKGGSWQR